MGGRGMVLAVSALLAAASPPAGAQGGRVWVDPPPRPAPESPSPSPGQAAPQSPTEQNPATPAAQAASQPTPSVLDSARPPQPPAGADAVTTSAIPNRSAQAARQLAIDYLGFWSAPNPLMLESMPQFYAPRVNFHGREMSARALFDVKSRFVKRWPVCSYTPRPESTQIACEPQARLCTVRSLFDFIALDPDRRRRSEGTATLELEISTAGAKPVILSEHSRILRRGRTSSTGGRDDADDDGPDLE
jgi:hypothetical protein